MARSRLAIDALTAWEWLQPEEHLFGAFEIVHYFPELMPELEAIKERTVSGLVFRRDHDHRRGRVPCLDNTTWRTGLYAGYR